MPVWSHHAEFEVDGGRREDEEILVQERAGRYRVIFPGPTNLETVIEFDHVTIGGNTIEFYRTRGTKGTGVTVKTGSVEAQSDVREFFNQYEP